MRVDWFTFAAQIINFLILIWLLKRFLYKPILNAIDTREKRIENELAEAASKMAEARAEQEIFICKNRDLESRQSRLMKDAADDADNLRQRLFEETRSESERLRLKMQEGLRNELQVLNREIARRTHEEVFSITKKVLSDLAEANLEGQIVELFVTRLGKLDDGDRQRLKQLLRISSLSPSVRSAFSLSPDQRSALEISIHETFAYDGDIQYTADPHIISGIELTINGYKLAWSITDYLHSMEKSVESLISELAPAARTAGEADTDQPDNFRP